MSPETVVHSLFEQEVVSISGKPLEPEKEKELDPKCPHYFGYLSEQGRDSNFPEECLVCPRAVKCIVVPSASLNADLYVKAIKENETRELAQFFIK